MLRLAKNNQRTFGIYRKTSSTLSGSTDIALRRIYNGENRMRYRNRVEGAQSQQVMFKIVARGGIATRGTHDVYQFILVIQCSVRANFT